MRIHISQSSINIIIFFWFILITSQIKHLYIWWSSYGSNHHKIMYIASYFDAFNDNIIKYMSV